MKKILRLIFFITFFYMFTCGFETGMESTDVISGLGYNGYERLMEDFYNN